MAGTGGYFNETNKLPAASAPYAKLITRHTLNSLGRNIYDIRRATVTGQGSDPTTIRMSPNGGCGASTTADVPVILGLDTQAMIDSYGLPILGGPSEPGPGNLFTQNIGPNGVAATLGFRSAKGLARKLPFLSGLVAGPGIFIKKYGTYDYKDENGVTHPAPGPADPVVNRDLAGVDLATVASVNVSGLLENAGDDANGLIVNVDGTTLAIDPITGKLKVIGLPCPSYLKCAIPKDGTHGLLNFGSGPWDGSAGQFYDAPSGTTELNGKIITMRVPPSSENGGDPYWGDYLTIQGPWSTSSLGPTAFKLGGFRTNGGDIGGSDDCLASIFMQGDVTAYSDTIQFLRHPDLPGTSSMLLYTEGRVTFANTGPPRTDEAFTCNIPASFTQGAAVSGALSSGTLTSGSVTSTGVSSFTADASNHVPVSILPHAGQTADLFQVGVSGGAFRIQPNGATTIGGHVTAPSLHITDTSTFTNEGRTDHAAMTAPATPATGYTSLYSRTVTGLTKLYFKDDAGTEHDLSAGSGGTVTSVDMSVPSALLAVSGNPVTTAGTFALSLPTRAANLVFAGPSSGGAATPAFRSLVAADIPDLSATYQVVGSSSGTGGDHLHGLARWVAGGGTTFNLPDLAEYAEMVFDNGSAVDSTTVSLSADRTQIVFDSAPTAGHVLQAEYVIARI